MRRRLLRWVPILLLVVVPIPGVPPGIASAGTDPVLLDGAEECTIGLADEWATETDRVTLWKVRDIGGGSYFCQQVVRLTGDNHAYLGVWTDGDWEGLWPKIYMGLNDAGLATGNSWVQDGGPDTNNSGFQRHALGTFGTITEVRDYIVDFGIGQGMHNVTACFPFIDREGNAVMFELDRNDDSQYWEYDSMAGARDLQGLLGVVVRANEFHKMPNGMDDTSIPNRYHSGTVNTTGLRDDGQLGARTIIQGDYPEIEWEFARLGPTDPPGETIARTTTRSAISVQGAAPDEDPGVATMWVLLGQTEFGIAVPTWVKADDLPVRLETCDMYDQASLLQSTFTQEEVQFSVLPLEKHLFDSVNDILLPHWRAEGVPAVEEVNRIEDRMAEDGYSLLYSLGHYEIGNLAPLVDFDFTVDDLTVQFTSGATDPDGSIGAHFWDFGDGSGTSTDPSPSYSYDGPGTYLVSYTVEDDDLVASTAWRYIDVGMYKLHLGIDPQTGEDLFPRETAEYDYFTAAAGSLMDLVFLDPEYAQDQQYLYSTYHQGPAGEEMAPAELSAALTAEAGSPYHFSPYGDTDQDLAIRRFIHWMDYQVPGVTEPNVPAMVPVDSTAAADANWVVVRGFASDVDPCDQGDIWNIPDVELFGVWLNDPRDQGLGYNYYQEAADFMAAYSAVEGEYLSIVEPPEGADRQRLDQLDEQLASGIHYRKPKPNPRLSRPTLDVQDDIDWTAVLPSALQSDESFMAMLEAAVEKHDFRVEGLGLETLYRLILLGPEDDELSTLPTGRVTVGVDLGGKDGEFRKASWTAPGQAYVPMSGKKAVEIARKHVKVKDAKVDRLARVWDASFDTSPFQPSHRVEFDGGETVIVHPDGSVLLL